MKRPKLYLALTSPLRAKRAQRALSDWEQAGYVEIRPGHFMLPEDLTPGQRRSIRDGNRIWPHQRFGWTLIKARGVRYNRNGMENS